MPHLMSHARLRKSGAVFLLCVGLALVLHACRKGQSPPHAGQPSSEQDDATADAAMVEGRWQESVDLHRKVLAADPEGGPADGLTMYHLGFSEGSLGRHRAEARWYEEALQAGYRSPDLLYNLGLARLALGEPVQADRALGEALKVRPDEAEFHYAAARAALALRDSPRAMERLLRATSLDPSHAEAWRALAELYEQGGDSASAAAARSRIR